MTKRLGAFWRDTGGAAAIEFAFVMGPLLLLMFAVFEFGRLCWAREALQETATATARCMSMSGASCASSGSYSAGNTKTYAETLASGWGITLVDADFTLNNNTSCAGVSATKGFSSVTIAYTFQSIVPNEVNALTGGKSLSSTACFPNY